MQLPTACVSVLYMSKPSQPDSWRNLVLQRPTCYQNKITDPRRSLNPCRLLKWGLPQSPAMLHHNLFAPQQSLVSDMLAHSLVQNA